MAVVPAMVVCREKNLKTRTKPDGERQLWLRIERRAGEFALRRPWFKESKPFD